MRQTGNYRFDQASITTILSNLGHPELSFAAIMIHGLIISNGYERETSIGNSLITSYFRCGCFDLGRRVFDEMFERNVITWTAMISGLSQNQFYDESLEVFTRMRRGQEELNYLTYLSSIMACCGLEALSEGRQIHGLVWKLGIQSDICIESALMDMYSKCGRIEDVLEVFESVEVFDGVSMTVVLVGFAQNGHEEEAVEFFVKMVKAGFEIDTNMVSAVLGVFGVYTSISLGKQIHSLIIKTSFDANVFVNNGLINMYSKCGDLNESIKVFVSMPCRNSVSWNSMIAASARHGNCIRALELYEDMRLDNVEPTDVTFLSLLHACSHMGFVEKGIEIIESMEKVDGISPRNEHYACIVDILARAGLLSEAKSYVENLPVKPSVLVWQALLGGCGIHGDSEVGKYAAEKLIEAEPGNPTHYISLANIYSKQGKWKERAGTIKRMKEMGISKETGISWIEIEKEVHSFVVEDRMHPQCETIYGVLGELFWFMKDEGYVPDKRFVLAYLDQDKA